MYKDEIFYKFIEILKERIPERGKLTNKLVDILLIEKEAVYRRLRGEVPFIFSEIIAISKAFHISIDSLVSTSTSKSRPFQLKMVDYLTPEEEDFQMLEEFLEGLKLVANDSSSEVGGALNILPQSICLGYENIYKFYLFKWHYQYGGATAIIPYRDVQPVQRLKEINRQIEMASRSAPDTYLIWDEMVYTNLVNDIKYFLSINLIQPEEVRVLREELLEYVNYMELLSIKGSFENGNKVHFYISSVTFETSYSYIETEELQMTMIKSFTLNDALSTDPVIFQRMKKWMQSLKRTSTLISESGEMQRILFFDKQRDIINTL